jgi:hypothetical protein
MYWFSVQISINVCYLTSMGAGSKVQGSEFALSWYFYTLIMKWNNEKWNNTKNLQTQN